MKKLLVLTFIAASALASTQAMAQGPRSNINLEPTCQGTGGGMDPRCIGDVTPGSDRALRRTRSGQRYDARTYRSRHSARHHTNKRVTINCSARANRNNPRCMRYSLRGAPCSRVRVTLCTSASTCRGCSRRMVRGRRHGWSA